MRRWQVLKRAEAWAELNDTEATVMGAEFVGNIWIAYLTLSNGDSTSLLFEGRNGHSEDRVEPVEVNTCADEALTA